MHVSRDHCSRTFLSFASCANQISYLPTDACKVATKADGTCPDGQSTNVCSCKTQYCDGSKDDGNDACCGDGCPTHRNLKTTQELKSVPVNAGTCNKCKWSPTIPGSPDMVCVDANGDCSPCTYHIFFSPSDGYCMCPETIAHAPSFRLLLAPIKFLTCPQTRVRSP